MHARYKTAPQRTTFQLAKFLLFPILHLGASTPRPMARTVLIAGTDRYGRSFLVPTPTAQVTGTFMVYQIIYSNNRQETVICLSTWSL